MQYRFHCKKDGLHSPAESEITIMKFDLIVLEMWNDAIPIGSERIATNWILKLSESSSFTRDCREINREEYRLKRLYNTIAKRVKQCGREAR